MVTCTYGDAYGVADTHVHMCAWCVCVTVYEPAEDSFLVMTALENDRAYINANIARFPNVVEIGTGSGIILSYAYNILNRTPATYIATDINPHAARAAMQTFKHNQVTSTSTHPQTHAQAHIHT